MHIAVAHLEPSSALELLLEEEFQLLPLSKQHRGTPPFANEVERVIRSVQPDLICFDITPTPWLFLVRFPDVPRVYLTNFFLTSLTESQTYQTRQLNADRQQWNELRRHRGMPDLHHAKTLYDADAVVLCDPVGLIPGWETLPSPYKAVGPIFWQPATKLPSELDLRQRLILASFGSTGTKRPDVDDVDELRSALDCEAVVWAVNEAPHELAPGNEAYVNIPLSPALERSVLALTQGGAGSTYAALSAGVPVAIKATNRNQEVLAERLIDAGVGALIEDLARRPHHEIAAKVEQMRHSTGALRIHPGDLPPAELAARTLLETLRDTTSSDDSKVRVHLGASPCLPGYWNAHPGDHADISWNLRDESLPLDTESVDVIASSITLDRITDDPGALSEIRRVLKPGGRFFVESPIGKLDRARRPGPHAVLDLQAHIDGYHAGNRVELAGGPEPSLRLAFHRIHTRRRFSVLPEIIRKFCIRLLPGVVKSVDCGLVLEEADSAKAARAHSIESEFDHFQAARITANRAEEARRLVLHIGTHKTGTTAFQHYMRDNLAFFHQAGLQYRLRDNGSAQAHELAHIAMREELMPPMRVNHPELMLDEARLEMTESIRSWLSTCRRPIAVMSHEALSFLRTKAEIERLKDLVGDDRKISILLVVRKPSDYLRTWKDQLQKMGWPDKSGFPTSVYYTEPDSWLVDYQQLIDVYTASFGAESVTVLSYEDEMDRYGSIVPALLRECGYHPNSIPPGWDRKRNVSPRQQ